MKNKEIKTALVCSTLLFVGCTKNNTESYVFDVTTGDDIMVALDTRDGYGITGTAPFDITLDDKIISNGAFIDAADYDYYVSNANDDEQSTIIETAEVNGNTYTFWRYDDSEWDYVILIGDTNTGLLLSNSVSEESAKQVFEKLTIELYTEDE